MKSKFFFMSCCLLLMAAGLFSYIQEIKSESPVIVPVDSRESIEIPIIMYHSLTENPSSESEYVISADRFESDLKWLSDQGYTTILPSQLIAYAQAGTRLPAMPVIISFDDGFANNYTLAFPLLQKYSAKAVIALIGSESDISSDAPYRDPHCSNLTWTEAATMARSGLVEFANHTYSLHSAASGGRKGADMLPGESFDAYRQTLRENLQKNQDLILNKTGKSPQVFAWPYGAYPMDGSADKILHELGFEASFISWQHTSTVYAGKPETLYNLGRYLRTPDFDMHSII